MARFRLLRPWTAKDDQELKELVQEGLPPSRIAAKLKRSEAGIRARASILGIKLDAKRNPRKR